MDLVEKIGSGINRMKEAMQSANLPEPEYNLEGIFAITLYRPVEFSKWLENWKDKLSQNQYEILKNINTNKAITKKELSEKIGIGKTAIDNNLARLKELDILIRVGSDRTGFWEINLTEVGR